MPNVLQYQPSTSTQQEGKDTMKTRRITEREQLARLRRLLTLDSQPPHINTEWANGAQWQAQDALAWMDCLREARVPADYPSTKRLDRCDPGDGLIVDRS